jgi:LPS-assembly lipoprotein
MRIFLPLWPLLLLTACGYTPLYAPPTGGQGLAPIQVGTVAMARVEIQPGQRLVAQEVAQRLQQAFPHTQGTTLNVEIAETTTALALERTATVRRAEITLTGTVRLLGATGQEALRVSLSAVAPYNVENNPFSTESGKSFARQIAARNLADSIVRRVALWQRMGREERGSEERGTR